MTAVASRPERAPVPPDPPPALGYRPSLDGARGLAVALVVAVHATYVLVPEWTGRWVPGGFLGVDVFFVLSGFLITTLLLEEHQRTGSVSLREFYARRARRLLPAVAVLLLAHAVLAVVAGADLGLEARTAGAVAFYGVNWVIAAGGDVAAGLGHLWSLSVEEQFYLVWPVLLLAALRRRRPAVALVVIAVAGIAWATGMRAWLWMQGAGWEAIYVRTDVRIDELLMGVLLAVAVRRGWALRGAWRHLGTGGLVVLLVCVATVYFDSDWLYTGGGFTVVGLAVVLLLASLLDADARLTRAFAWRPAVGLGRVSYSLYLWHAPVFFAVAERLAGRPPVQRLVVGLAACAVATLASYHLVELPFLRHRRRPAAAATPAHRGAVHGPAPALVPDGVG